MDGDVGNNRNCNIHDNADKNKNIHDGYIINSHTDPIKNNPK